MSSTTTTSLFARAKPKVKADEQAKTRVQFDLSPRAVNVLNELKDKTGAGSYAEVIRNAIKLYDGLITEVENGAEFMIRNKDGSVSPFKMFL
jgi:hypothetical protein